MDGGSAKRYLRPMRSDAWALARPEFRFLAA